MSPYNTYKTFFFGHVEILELGNNQHSGLKYELDNFNKERG